LSYERAAGVLYQRVRFEQVKMYVNS